MYTLILILHVVLCIFLIIVVLLQPGKGGDAGIAFGGGGSQSVFGARGATTFLQKLTTYAAVLFMVTTITLAWYSSESVSRESVIDENVLQNLDTTGEGADKAPATDKAEAPSDQSAGAGQSAGVEQSAGDAAAPASKDAGALKPAEGAAGGADDAPEGAAH